jgi:hypothetical protein
MPIARLNFSFFIGMLMLMDATLHHGHRQQQAPVEGISK